MDIQTRKLKAIEYLIGLNNENDLGQIESAITKLRKQQSIGNDVNPMTEVKLIERAKRSSSDYLSGSYKTQELLEQESENW